MAKKKKKKRRPVAPPVHSAPVSAPPVGAQAQATPPARPMGAEPPAPVATPPRRKAPAKRRSSRALRTKRSRTRPWVVGGLVLVLAVGAIAASKLSSNKNTVSFAKFASSGGCGKVETISGLTRDHKDGQPLTFKTSPPAGGDHYSNTISTGTYDEPFSSTPAAPLSLGRAVHSLEHGAVIVWYDGLTAKEKERLTDLVGGQEKAILVPYAGLKDGNKIALTAWSKLDYCKRVSTTAVDAFIAEYRDATTAPERFYPI